jgi:hypothetical protein
MPRRFEIPPFRPHPLIRNPHAQTLAGVYLPGKTFPYGAARRRVSLPDGDAVILHEDSPPRWRPGDRVALLLHGLAGSHLSSYMVRIAGKLNAAGVRTFRMDLRGCGAGEGLAARPYHAGRSEDARAALDFLAGLTSNSPVSVIGFSLSGNIILKMLGESPESVPRSVEKGAAVNPSLDLARCAQSLVGPFQRLYDRHFVRLLCRQVAENRRLRPELAAINGGRRLRKLIEFDDVYTGPVCGFGSGANYYAINSAARHVSAIRIPTLILAAKDDPLVPGACFENMATPAHVLLHLSAHGGHLGYIGELGCDADRRWMDWRIVDWVTCR